MGIGKQSILIQGKRKQARHARTLFDDGRKSRLLCIALSKTQSEKFLPHGFSHESKLESASNPRLVWPRTECGPDAGRRTRPAGRQYPGIAPKPRRQVVSSAKRVPLHSHSCHYCTTHGPRPSQGTSLIPSSYSLLHSSFPRLSF